MTSRIYAIGDVHGRADLLSSLIDFIGEHAERNGIKPRVFFLGDVVDQGPDSRGAMEIVCKTIERWPDSRLILGNHDEMFLKVLQDPYDGKASHNWLWNGGMCTQASYTGLFTEYWPESVAEIPTRYPTHYDILRSASNIETVGKYAFVHAGVDPSVPLADQDPKQLRWIRSKFLEHSGPLSHIIIHGHSVVEPAVPVVTENRISLDTGARASGVLTMVSIDPDTDVIEFFSTGADGNVRAVTPIRLDRGYGTALRAA